AGRVCSIRLCFPNAAVLHHLPPWDREALEREPWLLSRCILLDALQQRVERTRAPRTKHESGSIGHQSAIRRGLSWCEVIDVPGNRVERCDEPGQQFSNLHP